MFVAYVKIGAAPGSFDPLQNPQEQPLVNSMPNKHACRAIPFLGGRGNLGAGLPEASSDYFTPPGSSDIKVAERGWIEEERNGSADLRREPKTQLHG